MSVQCGHGAAPLGGHLAEKVRAKSLSATTATVAAMADGDVVVVPLFVDEEARPDAAWMDSASADIACGLQPGTSAISETMPPVNPPPCRWKSAFDEGFEPTAAIDSHLVPLSKSVLTGRVLADGSAPLPETLSRDRARWARRRCGSQRADAPVRSARTQLGGNHGMGPR